MSVGYLEDKRRDMQEQELNEISLQFSLGPAGLEAGYAGGVVRAGTKRALPAAGTWPSRGGTQREKGDSLQNLMSSQLTYNEGFFGFAM